MATKKTTKTSLKKAAKIKSVKPLTAGRYR